MSEHLSLSSARASIAHWLFGPTSAIRIRVFRWLLAWSLLIYTLAWARDGAEWLTEYGFHASGAATGGLQLPVPLLPGPLLWPFLGVYLLAIAAVIFGIRPRISSLVVFLCLLYVTYADRLGMFTINKVFIASWAALLFVEERAADVDESSTSEGYERDSAVPVMRTAWPMRVLQATLLVMYFGAGVCKTVHGPWLERSDVLWVQVQGPFRTDFAATLLHVLPPWAWTALQHGALVFEIGAPLLFCVRRLRPLGYILGGGMHLAIALLMDKVGLFSLQCVAFYVLFMDDARLRAVYRWTRWRGRDRRSDRNGPDPTLHS